jgi:formylglycine-generating enzyme required for sulfatase activity
VLRREDRVGAFTARVSDLAPIVTTWTDEHASPGHTYEYKVVALDLAGRPSAESLVPAVRADMMPILRLSGDAVGSDGTIYVRAPSVTVTLRALTATHRKITLGPDPGGQAWEAWSPRDSSFSFSPGTAMGEDGLKTISCKVKYDDGDSSGIVMGEVILDRAAPAAEMDTTVVDRNLRRVTVDGSAARDSADLTPPGSLRYRWTWGDDAVSEYSNSPTAEHTYTRPGPFWIKLEAADLLGWVGKDSVQVPLANRAPSAPVVEFPPASADSLLRFAELRWRASVDPENDTVRYRLYLGTTNPPPRVGGEQSTTSYDPPGDLAYHTRYFWKVTAIDAFGDSAMADPWTFTVRANQPPVTPSSPSPAEGATWVATDTSLRWSDCPDPEGTAVRYDVYFGTPLPSSPIATGLTASKWTPEGPLTYDEHYEWRVIASDADEATSMGALWSFTAVPPGFRLLNLTPPATFGMGSLPLELGYSRNEARHQVTLTKSFYLCDHEVTQAEWYAVMQTRPSYFNGDDLPVEQVSWNDCIDYCNARSVAEGLEPVYTRSESTVVWDQSKAGYRLPTEAEWEYACRAGSSTAFCNGAIPETGCGANPSLAVVCWYCGNANSTTHAVRGLEANTWGLYDMHGNVWEWCWDSKEFGYDGDATDPTGPAFGGHRVNRGGWFSGDAQYCRSASRNGNGPDGTSSSLGLRLSRTAP